MSCKDAISKSWASALFAGDLDWGVHVENVYRLGLDIKTAFDNQFLHLINSITK